MLFKNENVYTNQLVITSAAAATGTKAPNGVTLTAGDILVAQYVDSSGANHCIVISSSNALTTR